MTFSQKANEMQQAWDDIAKLLGEVQFILVEAKVPEHQVRMPRMEDGSPADPLRVKLETYVAAYDWLHDLSISAEYAAVVKVKALLPQHIWDMYALQDFRGMQEQVLLDKAQIKLRKFWKRNRPTFFGKVYKHVEETDTDANQGDASGVCVRSEGAGSDAGDCGNGES